MADLAKQLGVTVYQEPQNILPAATRLLQSAVLIGQCKFVEDRLDSGVRYGGYYTNLPYATTANVANSVIPTSSIVDLASVSVEILTSGGYQTVAPLTPLFSGSGTMSGVDIEVTAHAVGAGSTGEIVSGASAFTGTGFTVGMVGKYITYTGIAGPVSRLISAYVSATEVTLSTPSTEDRDTIAYVVSAVAIGQKLYVDGVTATEFTVADLTDIHISTSAALPTSAVAAPFKVFTGSGCIIEASSIRLTSGINLRGILHISYQATRPDLAGQSIAATTVADLTDIFGSSALGPENPLGYGMMKCLGNSGELYTIYGIPVQADTEEEHLAAIDILETNCRDWSVYFLVPLTNNETLATLYKNFVNKETGINTPIQKFAMCCLWTPKLIYKDILIHGSTGSVLMGQTQLEDPDLDFVLIGVAEGDFINVIAANGDESMARDVQSYVISHVSQHTLTVDGTFSEAVGPVDYEILTDWFYGITSTHKQKQAVALQKYAESYMDEHFWINFPDYFYDNAFVNHAGQTVTKLVDGYFANAAYVGSCIVLQPQQPLNQFRLSGFNSAIHSNNYFKVGYGKHIHIIESGGIAFATQQVESGMLTFIEQWTSNMSDQVFQYRSVIRNRDACKMIFIKNLCQMLGKDNLNDAYLSKFSRATSILLARLKDSGQAGPQASVSRVEFDPNDRTNVKVWLILDEPYPAHTAEVHFMI